VHPDAEALVEALRRSGVSLAVAESVTGGLVAKLVTGVPGAGDVFRGSIVSYVNDVKADLLGVDRGLLEKKGAVTAEAARQMARGARERLGADVAVSTSGFAGPNAPDGMPVGLVYVGVSTARGERAHEFRFDGSREEVRRQAAEAALRLAKEALGTLPPPGERDA
jgi:PncC family amidohydrolase